MGTSSGHVSWTPVTPDLAEKAAYLRAKHNLRTPDALHIVSAIHTGCDSFLTNDLGIKRVTELHVLVWDELELDPLEE